MLSGDPILPTSTRRAVGHAFGRTCPRCRRPMGRRARQPAAWRQRVMPGRRPTLARTVAMADSGLVLLDADGVMLLDEDGQLRVASDASCCCCVCACVGAVATCAVAAASTMRVTVSGVTDVSIDCHNICLTPYPFFLQTISLDGAANTVDWANGTFVLTLDCSEPTGPGESLSPIWSYVDTVTPNNMIQREGECPGGPPFDPALGPACIIDHYRRIVTLTKSGGTAFGVPANWSLVVVIDGVFTAGGHTQNLASAGADSCDTSPCGNDGLAYNNCCATMSWHDPNSDRGDTAVSVVPCP